jgi:hypothetical protein
MKKIMLLLPFISLAISCKKDKVTENTDQIRIVVVCENCNLKIMGTNSSKTITKNIQGSGSVTGAYTDFVPFIGTIAPISISKTPAVFVSCSVSDIDGKVKTTQTLFDNANVNATGVGFPFDSDAINK